MITVNLLHDVTSQAAPKKSKLFSSAVPVGTALTGALSTTDENTQLGIRVGMFLLPLILLIAFRSFQNARIESDYKRLQGEQQAIQTQLKNLDPIVKELEKYQEEKNKLNSQLQAIKVLSKERLKNVKSLDVLQGIIPSKAWLTSLKINDKNVDLDGMALDDMVIADFIGGLNSSIYFSNVKLVSSEEFKRIEGVVKRFKIKCNLENL